MPRTACPVACSLAVALAAAALVSCDSAPRAKIRAPEQAIVRDVPQPLRGTIGAEASFRGVEPVLVSGLGIVVGLNGTGGGELNLAIQTTMEREAARGGISKGGPSAVSPMGPMSPQEFLRRTDVAVVIVEARIPPGAPKGAKFDLSVRTLPGSSVTSLEGGQLWTTELRIGPAGVFGAVKSRMLAEGKGPIAINPFSEPSVGAGGELTITRTRGRVLNGGVVTDPLQVEMILDNESHTRARAVVQAINGKFPREPGDDGQIARGRGSGQGTKAYQSIALRVPSSYTQNPAEFLQLVRYMRVDQSFPQEYARQYVEALKANPGLAEDIRWLFQSLGKPSIPFVSQMYDYPEFAPRMAALAAGARLGDARAAAPLIDLAKTGPASLKTDAIKLLGDMPGNPSINLALRELLAAPDLDVKVAAYDSLRKRNDPWIRSYPMGTERGSEGSAGKFTLDLVPIPETSEPMIYVTQQGEPRVVVFGGLGPSGRRAAAGRPSDGLRVNKPMLVTCWGERFMMAAESSGDAVRLRYIDPRTNRPVNNPKAPEDVADLIEYMAHRTTPEDPKPGLNFTYSEVAGALYELTRQGGIPATFATEGDRLRAEIFEAAQATLLADRPEGSEQLPDDAAVFRPTPERPLPSAEAQPAEKKSRVVPLNKPKTRMTK